ncbi:PDDEXK nuclease domain-containing protein [Mycoplasmopsis bovirhinis]|uniref:PDDEXK nuclease domain-containing protein n=1 Tax=Mycoplasmopsis bovirhinis TaxID=29553 RepID=UPI000E755040|nr:PDDEXK nuclease domain-containing protein [Mycoplasmopsis bovirhinis]
MTKLKQSKIDLANKTVNYLQNLNKGYNLVETKKPIVVAGLNFYLDLVLFHEVLNSYLLINFKFTRINKTDIGKMQIYLNSYKNKLANNQATNLIGIIVLLNKKINKKI